MTDVDGKVRQSTCPVGDLRISAYRARVILTLPQGCSFAFGKRSDGYRLVGSIGGRYTITRNQWGYDFLRLDNTFSGRSGEKPACDGGASNLDYSTIPEGGPELIINVPYAIEGKWPSVMSMTAADAHPMTPCEHCGRMIQGAHHE